MKKLFVFSLVLILLVGVFAGPVTFVIGPANNVQAKTVEPHVETGNDDVSTLSPINVGGS